MTSNHCSSRRAPTSEKFELFHSVMAASSMSSDISMPSWRLQSRAHPERLASTLGDGGFATWTDVPRLPRDDPLIADQLKSGRRYLTANASGHISEPFGEGGKRVVGPHSSEPSGYGKRIYPEISARRGVDDQGPHGLKRVQSRARRDDAAVSNPNAIVGYTEFKPESVQMFPGRNTVDYSAWKPQELHKAEYGDWNWNTKLGFRKVKIMESGEPKRVEATPVAWPGYRGYPADLDAATGTRIDYSLKANGGSFTIKKQHADVIASRANRAAASVAPSRANDAPPTLYRRGMAY